MLRLLRHVVGFHKLEALFVSIASSAALTGLNHIEVHGIPLDRIGMIADVGAGLMFLTMKLKHRKGGHE